MCYNGRMERVQALFPFPEYVKFFVNRKEEEIFVKSAGYNDFHSVKPQFYARTQPHCTVHFLFGGRGTLNVNGKAFSVEKNQIFLLDNRCEFSYYPAPDDPWDYVWFDFGGTFAAEYLKRCGYTPDSPVKSCPNAAALHTTLYALFARAAANEQTGYFEFLSAFYLLMSSVAKEDDEPAFFYHDEYVEQIKRFIELKVLYEDFSVEYLAKSMHISHSHLCKIFKKSQGISVIAYVNALRLQRAAELLEKTDFTAREIAYMSGFKEYEYFLKCFKRRYGMTTTVFRMGNKR
ncbi:MAG: hypothetical protein DBX59_09750 [Bacillota bacterium]|nr:MAG: hypothetical protein DBX59_09750 [Bacillota bacterium]